jgi:hypothetical protein
MKKVLVLSIVTICLTIALAFAAEPEEVWNVTYPSDDNELGYGVAVDSEGNCYVVGGTVVSSYPDAIILKYNSEGNFQWKRTFVGDYGDKFFSVAVDSDGYVYAGGETWNATNTDLLVVKYKPDGDSVWVRILDTSLGEIELYEDAKGIAVDDSYVYVTGAYSFNDVAYARTTIYDKDNDYVGVALYEEGEFNDGFDVAVDDAGNFYVSGRTGVAVESDFLTVMYDSERNQVWARPYDLGGFDIACGIALDADENVYVAGRCKDFNSPSYGTMRFDNNGFLDWIETHKPYEGCVALDIAVFGEDVYVTGYKKDTAQALPDFLTIGYDRQGNLLWEKVYDSGYRDCGRGIFADNQGYFYVTGESENSAGNYDIRLIKYEIPASITVTSPNGGEQWVIGETYNITWDHEGFIDSVMIEYLNESVVGFDTIAVVANTGTYLWTIPNTPGTQTRVYVSDVADYADVRDASDADFTIATEGVEDAGLLSTLSLEVTPEGLIRYQVPGTKDVTLKVYAVDGSLALSELITSSSGELRCDGLVPGVYFVRLTAGIGLRSKKLVLTR